MKLTKETLKRMIKEELEGSIAGKDIPNEAKYPELLGGIKKLLDGAFGKNYNLFRELKAMAEYYATKKPNLDSIGDKKTAAGPSDTGHVYVLFRTIGDRDPVLWGIFSSKENVEKWIENESAAAAADGVEFNKGDYSYGKRVIDPSEHPPVDKGK